MKKIAIAGIAVLFAMFLITCDGLFPNDENETEYTDVVYSEDGSKITLYLDGVGVPKTAAQRAMSTRLSKMAYDYLEVIFIGSTTADVARAQWELGQSAGISGVERDVDYEWTTGDTTKVALIIAGRKEGKTLLGIGDLRDVDESPGTTVVAADSKSVTFYVTAVKTGLLVEGETTTATTGNDYGILFDSMLGETWSDSSRTKLGNQYIPTYPLSEIANSTQTATYTFYGAADTYESDILLAVAGAEKVRVEPRFPRYQDNGRYKQLSATVDMRSEVKATQPTTFSKEVSLTFTSKGTGIFSFYIEIPVYVLTNTDGVNTGKLKPVKWNIRTGLGSELYSLDDGVAGGGCVLMSIGKLDLEDWLDIQWEWVTTTP